MREPLRARGYALQRAYVLHSFPGWVEAWPKGGLYRLIWLSGKVIIFQKMATFELRADFTWEFQRANRKSRTGEEKTTPDQIRVTYAWC